LNPLDRLLNRKAIHLVMFGFVMGARFATGNAIATNKALLGFISTFGLDIELESITQTLSRIEEEYRIASK